MQYRINERPKYKLNFYSPEEIFFLNLKHKVAFSSWNDNFNSMIVRLKVTLVINEDDFYNGFNSMIVRLKEA